MKHCIICKQDGHEGCECQHPAFRHLLGTPFSIEAYEKQLSERIEQDTDISSQPPLREQLDKMFALIAERHIQGATQQMHLGE